MRWRVVCVSVLIAAAAAPGASGQDALDAIDGCLRRLDPRTDIGYERIAARCPDLTRRLDASASAAWLPRDWQASDNVSMRSLQELRTLIGRELAARTSARAPDSAALAGILARLGPLEPHRTWSRFTRWLREALARDDPAAYSGWWDRMTAQIGASQTAIEIVCYLCLGIVVALALAVIVNELRLAGVFALRPKRTGARAALSSNTTSAWAALQSAPAPERPRLLLELIAARLMELNRLPAAGGLTVRELLRTARFSRGEDGSLLAGVALAAERVRFSAERVPESALLAAVEGGRRLLERLDA